MEGEKIDVDESFDTINTPWRVSESNKPLDTTYDVVAPENIAFTYQTAGPFIRMLAYSFDLIAIGIYLTVTLFGFLFLGKYFEDFVEQFLVVFLLLNLTFVFWFWNACFEAFWRGRTLGKAILGLRVLTTSGRPIGFGQALLRNILRVADLALGPFVVLIMGTNDRMARLGDIAADTIVIVESRDRRKSGAKNAVFKEPAVEYVMSRLSDEAQISESLCQTLALYVSRRLEIPPLRRNEIAAPLANLLTRKFHLTYQVDPDVLLRALYQRSLDVDRLVR